MTYVHACGPNISTIAHAKAAARHELGKVLSLYPARRSGKHFETLRSFATEH